MPWVSGRGGSVRGDRWIFRGPGLVEVHLRVSLTGGAVDLLGNSSRPFALLRPLVRQLTDNSFIVD